MLSPQNLGRPGSRSNAFHHRIASRPAGLAALALAAALVQGYHPFAEDGGVYVAGIEYLLHPQVFPHYTAFVTEHLRFSLFAPATATLVHALHLPLSVVLLLVYFAGWSLLMLAASRLLRRCGSSQTAELAACALLAAAATVPVAGTSLLLMDPYVTARTLSTPLSLLALAFALPGGPSSSRLRDGLGCAFCLVLAATLHPLMAGYAAAFVLALHLSQRPRRLLMLSLFTIAVLGATSWLWLVTGVPAEGPALIAAELSRYYWFLSQWQWFELLGLAGPLVVLALLLRSSTHPARQSLLTAALFIAILGLVTALLFAHADAPSHLIARLQPLRVFVLVYAVMLLLLGATLIEKLTFRLRNPTLAIALAAVAALMFLMQRSTFPASLHLELPGRANPNPWVRAFVWVRENTPTDALFALDARYINEDGEDAQTFRATAQRSALPDYSKDGGEAAITPALAETWLAGATAQRGLSQLDDAQRNARLRALGATWMVLHASAPTAQPCPYANAVVKVCRLAPSANAPR